MINILVGMNTKLTVINNVNELVEIFNEEERDEFSSKKKTHQILQDIGIGNDEYGTRQIIDERTEQILEYYMFYMKAPHQAPIDNNVWKFSVSTLNVLLNNKVF